MDKIKWGVMGAGRITNRWIRGARQWDDMEVAALGVRNRESGLALAKENGIEKVLSLEAFLESRDITAVYVAVPHSAHMEYALQAMEHGKHVLVEKPMAVNAQQAKRLIDSAKKNKVLLMEAVWTRFFPAMQRLQNLEEEGIIGDVRAVYAAFSYRVTEPTDSASRIVNPSLAGGGLLDVGVYPLHFADALFNASAEDIAGFAAIDSDHHHIQVDEQAAFVARYSRGRIANMACGIRTPMSDTAQVFGTEGSVTVPVFWKPETLHITTGGTLIEENYPVPQRIPGIVDEGFQFEIQHFNACIREGRYESPVMPPHKSLAIITLCDRLRQQWNLQYPFEVSAP